MLAVHQLAHKVNLDTILLSLQQSLEGCLDSQWRSSSGELKPSERFSAMNPIDQIVQEAKKVKDATFVCMIEACSGSGKSLCAIDYFIRNRHQCMYFLFIPSARESRQMIYEHVSSITTLIARAMDCDLCGLTKNAIAESEVGAGIGAFDVDVKKDGRKWHVLGALGYLWRETNTVAPVSVQEARSWTQRWVLMDETILPQQDQDTLFSLVARLVLLRRILINSNIHCIMLGTNTLVMNFNKISRKSDYSRDGNRRMYCFTYRSLPQFVLRSRNEEEILKRIFGESQISELLDNVNPWLCSLFLDQVKEMSEVEPSECIRSVSKILLNNVRMQKPNLRDDSVYCMFQVAAHQPLSQLHISKGFAHLNVWKGTRPARGSRDSIVGITADELGLNPRIEGTLLPRLTSSFSTPVQDPIMFAVCAGGGRPFSGRSALEVLQQIHEEAKIGSDPVSLDAYKRDGNLLESFGASVMMISSWSRPQDLLLNIAFHCGNTNEQRNVDQILASVASKDSFKEILMSCMSNLIPVRVEEQNHTLAAVLGFYIREKDRKKRDGTFAGPLGASRTRTIGGSKMKNRKHPLDSSQLSDIISRLVSKDLDVILCMAPKIAEGALEGCIKATGFKTEWLVLHLKFGRGWAASSIQTDASDDKKSQGEAGMEDQDIALVKRRVLMVVEVGAQTEPFAA